MRGCNVADDPSSPNTGVAMAPWLLDGIGLISGGTVLVLLARQRHASGSRRR
ncbi:hypothetical protein ACFOOK_13805 [Micromonospora krabiensis]|uniref:Uncharacterized protein n=1 Tax=Micromonospora krabiensis TaxID=307121 RepID=A0A1C3N1N5_9ACTN|nr:hypothetical protein [Micromonospora krabiensis]SBV26489.1 hypothetical protein GA0070620_1979 [Micromonospora krabiensis]